jgi:hypothetical protein
MSKINCTPREGFTVRDHKGKVIPAEGAAVDDSPVIQRRLREGLLVEGLAGDVEAKSDEDEVIDLDKMTVPELKAALKDAEVEFPDNAKKADLLALLSDYLESLADE